MHTPDEQAGFDSHVQQTEPNADAEGHIEMSVDGPFEVLIGDTYLPCLLADGQLYVSAPLQSVLDAFASCISQELCGLESRISEARRAALSLTGLQRTFSRAGVVITSVVPGSGEF